MKDFVSRFRMCAFSFVLLISAGKAQLSINDPDPVTVSGIPTYINIELNGKNLFPIEASMFIIKDLANIREIQATEIRVNELVNDGDQQWVGVDLFSYEYDCSGRYTVHFRRDVPEVVSKESVKFKSCDESISRGWKIDIKPLGDGFNPRIDFKAQKLVTGDDDFRMTWSTKGYVNLTQQDTAGYVEAKANGYIPLSEGWPHATFLFSFGFSATENFNHRDWEGNAGFSFVDHKITGKIISKLSRFFTGIDRPTPPPVIAIYAEAYKPWRRPDEQPAEWKVRLCGEFDLRIPFSQTDFVDVFGKGWTQENSDSKGFIEFGYRKQVTRDMSVLLKWLNGELPPIFVKDVSVMAGLSFLLPVAMTDLF